MLVDECADAYLIIAGEGSLKSQLLALMRELNLEKCVDFIGLRKDIFTWISQADVFVLTSDYEGLPMVIIEAMACGTPVVTTDFEGAD